MFPNARERRHDLLDLHRQHRDRWVAEAKRPGVEVYGQAGRSEEAQILAVVDSTVGMVGDLQGIAGKAMPEIPSLDMPLPEASTEGSQLAFRSSAE